MFSTSFYKKPPSKKVAHRFIASQNLSELERDIQHSKLMGLEFKSNPLLTSLIVPDSSVSIEQINKAPIREFSMEAARRVVPEASVRPTYTLQFTPKFETQCEFDSSDTSNPLCWGDGNTLYVATRTSVFACDYESGENSKLVAPDVESPFMEVSSLSYNPHQNALIMGRANGQLFMYSAEQEMMFLSTKLNSAIHSIKATDFWHSYYLLTSLKLNHLDIRQSNKPTELQGIGSVVYKLGMDKRGTKLAISDWGGIYIYDVRNMSKAEMHLTGHKMTTKALAFAPHSERLLATGGGVTDETIKIWDLQTATVKAEENIQTEVCKLHWLDRYGLFATEGKGAEDGLGNAVSCWSMNQKGLSLEADVAVHEDKVLFSAQHPSDPSIIATASLDRRVSLWSVGNVIRENHGANGKGNRELSQQFQIR